MKVGEYVKTKRGIIGKIKLIDNQTELEDLYLVKRKWYYKEDFIKSSPNIIDLIEVGDYVNGYKVSFVDEEPVMGKFVQCDYEVSFGTTNHYRFYAVDIKSIVTKEQFSQMEYRIGE